MTLDMVAVVAVTMLAVAACAWYVALLRGGGRGWAWGGWRLGCLVAGWAVVVWALWAGPWRWGSHHWVDGLVVGLVSTVASFLMVVAQPLELVLTSHPDGLVARVVRTRPVRWLLFPLVAAPLNCLLLVLVFTTGWHRDASSGGWGWPLLVATVLAGGLTAGAGLLSDELLPDVGPGRRMLFSAIDGLLDEIPGIVVMTTVDQWTGAAMWCVAQPVVIPTMAVLAVQWVRADQAEARAEDARLDALEQDRGASVVRDRMRG